MTTTSEAYILVTLPNASLTSSSLSSNTGTGTRTLTGQLALEYVTFDIPTTATASGAAVTQDVLLVLVLRTGTGDNSNSNSNNNNNNNNVAFEAPLDPARALTVSSLPPSGARRYVFHATRDDVEFTVELPVVTDDVELFHSVLEGYVADLRVHGELPPSQSARGGFVEESAVGPEGEDLRGRFVLMNEDDGEVVGTLDRSVRVREDRSLAEKGHERDPVVVELPEGADTVDGLMDEEVLVRTIPPEDRDWMLNGAVFVSHAISGTTTLLTWAMTTASNLYIAHSTPSTSPPTPRPNTPSSSSSSSASPPPSRTLLILQSPTTRKNLARIYTVSGGAVKLSSKAAAAVGSLIQRTVGTGGSGASGKGRTTSVFTSDAVARPPTLPPRSRGPSPAPPDGKPPLPPRHGKSPSPSPFGSRVQSPAPQLHPPTTPLRTRTSLALSAALILASLEVSSVRLVDAGGAAVSAAVSHKYGTAAGENAAIAGRTARNIVLVYVDVRGLGRRVIVKRMAKTWVKGHIAEESAALRK